MKIQLIRHATLIIFLNNKRILVDPMLSKVGSLDAVPNVPNKNKNPLVELPITEGEIINCDAALITHTHRDHFDDSAAKLLPKTMPIFCQPNDTIKFKDLGFLDVTPVLDKVIWNDITLNRTEGRHGHGQLAIAMAPVSGFVISYSQEPSVYIAGDTIFCKEVENSIEEYKPKVIVCNCGAAQFHYGEPITMTSKDIRVLNQRYPQIKIVAVHVEAWNHCRESKKDLKNSISQEVFIPENGEILNF